MPQFLDRSATGDQLHQKHNNGYHEKNVDQITYGSSGEPESKSPQHQQDQNDCPKHNYLQRMYFPSDRAGKSQSLSNPKYPKLTVASVTTLSTGLQFPQVLSFDASYC
jgi:hypothetical protein